LNQIKFYMYCKTAQIKTRDLNFSRDEKLSKIYSCASKRIIKKFQFYEKCNFNNFPLLCGDYSFLNILNPCHQIHLPVLKRHTIYLKKIMSSPGTKWVITSNANWFIPSSKHVYLGLQVFIKCRIADLTQGSRYWQIHWNMSKDIVIE